MLRNQDVLILLWGLYDQSHHLTELSPQLSPQKTTQEPSFDLKDQAEEFHAVGFLLEFPLQSAHSVK